MNLKNILILSLALVVNSFGYAQVVSRPWEGKKCAVVLTYDDALNVHLDKVIPMLDSFKLKGTFYVIGASPVLANRMSEWRAAAQEGHELGNHSLNHPCDGTLPGRGFVTKETDLSRYSVARAVNEIRITNTLLKAIDGKSERTFAYPCGDLTIGDTLFYNLLKNDFVAARGVIPAYPSIKDINLSDVTAFAQHENTAAQMIVQVEEAEKAGSLVVFLFHGVGGEHPLNISLEEHRKLLVYLKKREKDIWIAPMVEVAKYIKRQQGNK